MAIDIDMKGNWCVKAGQEGHTRYELIGTDKAFEVARGSDSESIEAAKDALLAEYTQG